MYCRNCGNVLGDGQFCSACGTPKVEEQNTNSGVQAQQPVEQLTPAQPVVQEEFSQPVAPVAPVAPVQNFEQPPNNNNL